MLRIAIRPPERKEKFGTLVYEIADELMNSYEKLDKDKADAVKQMLEKTMNHVVITLE